MMRGMARFSVPALMVALLTPGCGHGTASLEPDGGTCSGPTCNFPFTAADQVSSVPAGTPVTGGWHVDVGTIVTYDEQPPVGGYHYPVWAIWGTHTDPVPLEYLVHNEEHGGVLLLYNCDAGCPDLVAQLQGVVDSQPQDPLCASEGTGVNARLVLVPDRSLDIQFAAAAWGWWYRPAIDGGVNVGDLQTFITDHIGNGREAECAQGGYP